MLAHKLNTGAPSDELVVKRLAPQVQRASDVAHADSAAQRILMAGLPST
jgi:hypothetical protein